jgi:hypothetical protein
MAPVHDKSTNDVSPGSEAQASWQLPADAELTPPYAPGEEKLSQLAARAFDGSRDWEIYGTISPHESKRFNTPEGMHFFRKPLWVEVTCGAAALLLIVGQMWAVELCRTAGWNSAGYSGFLRLGMLLLGAGLLFIAAPFYKPSGWTPEVQHEEDAAHKHFRGKRRF